jgi:hypothetical protein
MASRIVNKESERPFRVPDLEFNRVIRLDLLSLFHAVGPGRIVSFKDDLVGFEVIRDA